eukprot:2795476-Prymnesium_polylepis.1
MAYAISVRGAPPATGRCCTVSAAPRRARGLRSREWCCAPPALYHLGSRHTEQDGYSKTNSKASAALNSVWEHPSEKLHPVLLTNVANAHDRRHCGQLRGRRRRVWTMCVVLPDTSRGSGADADRAGRADALATSPGASRAPSHGRRRVAPIAAI